MANSANRPVEQTEIDVLSIDTARPAYIDWSAVIAGTAIASAMSLMLYGFGASIGLYVAQPWSHSETTKTVISMAAIIFVALAYLYSLAMGSYFAGRLRPRHAIGTDEARFRDGASGLVVWAASLLVGALIASNAVVGTVDRAAQATSSAASGVSTLVSPLAQKAVDDLLRAPASESNQATTASSAEPANAPPASPAEPASEPAATSEEPAAPASPTAAPTRETIVADQSDSNEEVLLSRQLTDQILRMVARSLSDGEISEADKEYLSMILEKKLGYQPEEAAAAVNQKLEAAIAETKKSLEEAKETTAFAGFWTAIVVLLSAVASWWAASLGGAHRDEAAIVAEHAPIIQT